LEKKPMIHDRKRVVSILEAVHGGLQRVLYLRDAIREPALHEHLEIVQNLFEHVGLVCLKLPGDQQATIEQEGPRLDNAERIVDIATKQMDSLERIYKVRSPTKAAS
jgi:hypothetical protein